MRNSFHLIYTKVLIYETDRERDLPSSRSMRARASRSASESIAKLLSDLRLARDFLRVVGLTGNSSDSSSDNTTVLFHFDTVIDDFAAAIGVSAVLVFVGASSR